MSFKVSISIKIRGNSTRGIIILLILNAKIILKLYLTTLAKSILFLNRLRGLQKKLEVAPNRVIDYYYSIVQQLLQ